MKVELCDCCKTRRAKGKFVMDSDGIHPPNALQRQDGFSPLAAIDLCEPCSVSLRFHWGACATSRDEVAR